MLGQQPIANQSSHADGSTVHCGASPAESEAASPCDPSHSAKAGSLSQLLCWPGDAGRILSLSRQQQPALPVTRQRASIRQHCGVWLVYGTHERRYRRRSLCCGHEAVLLGDQAGSHQFRLALACIGAIQPRRSPPDARSRLGRRSRQDARACQWSSLTLPLGWNISATPDRRHAFESESYSALTSLRAMSFAWSCWLEPETSGTGEISDDSSHAPQSFRSSPATTIRRRRFMAYAAVAAKPFAF